MMEQRNLDFEIEMSDAQWDSLVRTADTLGPTSAGFDEADRTEEAEIQVYMRPGDLPSGWQDWVGTGETYGSEEREVARFHFNSGRPYAEIDLSGQVAEPVYTDEEVTEMQIELERWIRGKWHELLRESGIHYDRGHTAP